MSKIRSLCVFCGSRSGTNPAYVAAARELGHQLADRGIRLVYGGGNVGMMGVVADGVLERGGQVTGVIPEALVSRELAHVNVLDMRIVPTMHTRKALMAELSDGFIALPGGIGTFEELMEVLTWRQLGFHEKRIALLNLDQFFDPLLLMLDRAVQEGFFNDHNRNQLDVARSVPELLSFFHEAYA